MKNLTRKILSLVLTAALACGCLLTASAENTPYGDINLDGIVTSDDALAVLEHTVGKAVLDDDAFLRADVNADGFADSTDALDILCYYVGLKAEFDVVVMEEEARKQGTQIDMPADEILALYSQAVLKARESRPEYLFESTSRCTQADVTVKDPLGLLKATGGVSAKEMEQMTEETMLAEKNPVKRVMLRGSTNSYVNLPAECTLTDASKLKSISVYELEDGNYRIVIQLNDEIRPAADSTACRILGVADYDTVLAEVKAEISIDDAEGMTDAEINELSYKNGEITCILNPETMEIVDFNMEADMFVDYSVKVFAILSTISIRTVSNTHNVSHFSYFSY